MKGGPGTNTAAIGARVKVTAGGKTWLQELSSGGRFGATNTFRLHFGLGNTAKVDKVEIRWPNKKMTVTTLEGLEVDQAIEVTEATGKWAKLWNAPRLAQADPAPAPAPEKSAAPAKTAAPAKK